MKKCPLCAERIRNDAIKCRYCGSLLVQEQEAQKALEASRAARKQGPWAGLIVALLAVIIGILILLILYSKVNSFFHNNMGEAAMQKKRHQAERSIIDTLSRRLVPVSAQGKSSPKDYKTVIEDFLNANLTPEDR